MASSDLLRHALDLRERTAARSSVEAGFRRAVELSAPVIGTVLQDLDRDLLEATGTLSVGEVTRNPDGGMRAEWRLAWPMSADRAQARGATGDGGDVVIAAWLGPNSPHGHLTGNGGGNWPLAVDGPDDLDSLRATAAAIAEASLHARIQELGWEILPAAHHG